jgi:hypothetical protein
MPQLPPQTGTDIPENTLPDKLRDDWLPNDPKPRSIQMVRQNDGKWTVTRSYD